MGIREENRFRRFKLIQSYNGLIRGIMLAQQIDKAILVGLLREELGLSKADKIIAKLDDLQSRKEIRHRYFNRLNRSFNGHERIN